MSNPDNHFMENLKAVMVPVHPAGTIFIVIFALLTMAFAFMSIFLFFIGLVLTVWCVYFFRDPPRITPMREGLVVAPGDGIIQKILKLTPPAILGLGLEERTRISIFLNVFDVHINRVPIDGEITKIEYTPGTFVNASLDKASEDNERNALVVTTPEGMKIGVIQIAGLVARRILCFAREGQSVRAGERFGLIRFGSRVDIFLPPNISPLVLVGQRMVGGETVVADLKSSEFERVGNKQ